MILVPGLALWNRNFMAVVMLVLLMFLFLGIAISADIFMEAIEVITSKVILVNIYDRETGEKFVVE